MRRPLESIHRRSTGRTSREGGEGPAGTVSSPKLLIIVGPTGVGKTQLSLELATTLGGEIVGCDAFQVYQNLNIGTAKPSAEEMGQIPHHCIDTVPPSTHYTAAQYVRDADQAIQTIHLKGKVPIIVGGTGMYLRALLKGLDEAPKRHAALRHRFQSWMKRFGTQKVHRVLHCWDATAALKIEPNDAQRLVRALEIAYIEGPSWRQRIEAEGVWSSSADRYPALKIGLDLDRDQLKENIATRVRCFYDQGWVEEVRALLAEVPANANAFKAIGYQEIAKALESGLDPKSMQEKIIIRTRQYSKRQRTWFKKEPGIQWFDLTKNADTVADRVIALWRQNEC